MRRIFFIHYIDTKILHIFIAQYKLLWPSKSLISAILGAYVTQKKHGLVFPYSLNQKWSMVMTVIDLYVISNLLATCQKSGINEWFEKVLHFYSWSKKHCIVEKRLDKKIPALVWTETKSYHIESFDETSRFQFNNFSIPNRSPESYSQNIFACNKNISKFFNECRRFLYRKALIIIKVFHYVVP